MKKLLVILLLLPMLAFSQYKIQVLPASLMFVSGTAKGYADVLSTHYSSFQSAHPNANPQFWNPDKSWRNKWKDGSTTKERFLGSSTVFVATTDGWHLANAVNKTALIGAIVLKMGHKQPFRYYLYDFAIYSAAYSAGFWTVYELIYK